MPKGLQSFGRKQRREVRRRNHIAYDLANPKYRQRIKDNNKKPSVKKDNYNADEFDW